MRSAFRHHGVRALAAAFVLLAWAGMLSLVIGCPSADEPIHRPAAEQPPAEEAPGILIFEHHLLLAGELPFGEKRT